MGLMAEERKSRLNPDAPLFIPAAVRQVEDFSPEWWQLVTTSTWYRDYWLSQNQQVVDNDNLFYEYNHDVANNMGIDYGFDYDVADLLPDGDDLFQELAVDHYETQFQDDINNNQFSYGFVLDTEAEMKNFRGLGLEATDPKSPLEAGKYAGKLVN